VVRTWRSGGALLPPLLYIFLTPQLATYRIGTQVLRKWYSSHRLQGTGGWGLFVAALLKLPHCLRHPPTPNSYRFYVGTTGYSYNPCNKKPKLPRTRKNCRPIRMLAATQCTCTWCTVLVLLFHQCIEKDDFTV
jgi:hypothetical protein